jgi:myo-inositol-1(or 4)-monophosphatase
MTELPTLEFAIDIARKAGELIKQGAAKVKTVNAKSSVADLVTEFDVAVEKFLKELISTKFPSHSFLAEESAKEGQRLDDTPTWIIDPIDGTTNFVHSFPFFCVSIGFAVKQEVVLGVIFNPITEEFFYAAKNQGAFLISRDASPQRLLLAHKADVRKSAALVSTGFSVPTIRGDPESPEVQRLHKITLDNVKHLQLHVRDIRRIGSAALDLCFVASGRTDSYFEFGVKEWDVAAGVLILEEAGGYVCSVGGKKFDIHGRNILACNNRLLSEDLVDILTDFSPVSI